MKKILSLTVLILSIYFTVNAQVKDEPVRTIFASGGNYGAPFIKYVIALTKKNNPRICFMPSATGDSPASILTWYKNCEGLPMQPFVQNVFVASARDKVTFEQNLLSMDAIIVGGGNTMNMIAIWKVQGIDTVLRKAYNKGIILGGGSAGSVCWFQGGTTDSRPAVLSVCEGLGFIPTSQSPHWLHEPLRRPLYREAILSGKLKPGYACDDASAILFQNEKYVKSVAVDTLNKTWFVSVEKGKIVEKLLPVTEIIK
jgi:dipeptidase E